MGSIVAELAEKLTSATNSFDIDEQTLYVNTSADTVGIGTNSPDGKLSVHQSGTDDIFNLYDGTTNILTVADGGTLTHKGTLLVGVDDTGHDVKFFGDTSGKYWMWDTSADGTVQVGNSQLTGNFTVGVDDTGHDVKFFGPTSGAYMEWEGDNNDRLVLMGATTKLGINEATPALPLHISHSSTNTSVDDNSSSHSAIMLQNTSNTDGNYTGIWNRDADNDATNAAIIFKNVSQSNSTSSMHFLTRASGAGAAVRMVIDADGKVGIGTNTPDQLLVVSDTGNSVFKLEAFTTTAGQGPNMILARSNNGTLGNQTAVDSGDNLGGIYFQGSSGTAFATGPNIQAYANETWSGTASGSTLRFYTVDNTTTTADERMRIDHNGNIGIGTTNPTQTLHVDGTVGGTAIKDEDDMSSNSATHLATQQSIKAYVDANAGSTYSAGNGLALSGTTFSVDSLSHLNSVTIGRLTIDGAAGSSATSKIESGSYSSGTADLRFHTMEPYTNSGNMWEKLRITGNGKIVGRGKYNTASMTVTTSSSRPGFEFGNTNSSMGGICGVSFSNTSSSQNHFFFGNTNGNTGSINTSGSGCTFNSLSDYRKKENVIPISDAEDRLNKLKPSRFNFISDKSVTLDGFLAHEVSDVVPEAVIGEKDAVDEDGEMITQQMDNSKLIPLLVATVQELSAKVKALESA